MARPINCYGKGTFFQAQVHFQCPKVIRESSQAQLHNPTSDKAQLHNPTLYLQLPNITEGKSHLSLDLATRFPFFEIANADKMQLYRGLDITTNELPPPERLGVPHHLLGELDPLDGDFTPADFRTVAGQFVSGITNRRKGPMLVGGSNSFVHAMVAERFEPGSYVFEPGFDASVSAELRDGSCCRWIPHDDEKLLKTRKRVASYKSGTTDPELQQRKRVASCRSGMTLGSRIGWVNLPSLCTSTVRWKSPLECFEMETGF